MKSSSKRCAAALWFLWLPVNSCTEPVVELTEVLNYSSCQTLKQGARWVDFDELGSIRGVVMQTPLNPPPQKFLAISRGTQPSAGYAFALQSYGADGSDLTLELNWIEPAAETVQAQMLTTPCLIIGIHTSADIGQVRITLSGENFAAIDYPTT